MVSRSIFSFHMHIERRQLNHFNTKKQRFVFLAVRHVSPPKPIAPLKTGNAAARPAASRGAAQAPASRAATSSGSRTTPTTPVVTPTKHPLRLTSVPGMAIDFLIVDILILQLKMAVENDLLFTTNLLIGPVSAQFSTGGFSSYRNPSSTI